MSARTTSIERRLLSYSSAAKTALYLAVGAQFLAVVLVVLQAWLLSEIVSRVVIGRQTLGDVRPLLFVMLSFALGRAVFVWVGDVLAQRSASHLKTQLRTDLTDHLVLLGPKFSQRERSGELVSVAGQGVEDLDEYMALYQPLRFLVVLVPAFVALVVFAIDPLTLLVLLMTGPILILLLVLIGRRARELTQRRFLELSWTSAFLLDMLQGLPTLKMFGRSREQIENVRSISSRFGSTTMDVLRTAFETSFVLELSSTIAVALVAVEVSLRLIHGGLPFNHALAVLIITPEFFLPLRQLSGRYHAGSAGQAAGERIFAILDTPFRHPDETKVRMSGVRLPAEIRLEHVSVSYEEGARPALDDLSFDIPQHGTVALVGETGAGKTTVASLLLRFIEPDSGSINIGGVPLRSLEPKEWRSQIAWVPQHPHLFHGTVAENVWLARPDAKFDEVIAACHVAHAHHFIRGLHRGYDTVIGENGTRLSGGERQRLAIARAFLKNAPFVILDEATSHLDAETEAGIIEALERLLNGRMALIITHRLSLSRIAQQVVVMKHGCAVEVVNPGELRTAHAYEGLVEDHQVGVS